MQSASCGDPKTPSRTTDTILDCAFGENTVFFDPKIGPRTLLATPHTEIILQFDLPTNQTNYFLDDMFFGVI